MLKRILGVVAVLVALAGLAYAQVFDEVAYGDHPKHRMDVYAPKSAESAPVVLMLHGGGWRGGNKRWPNVWFSKSRHFLSKGYVFVSTATRLMPDADPLEQVQDLARAMGYVQEHAAEWGGDPERIILMGHSSGAHVATLLGLQQDLLAAKGLNRPVAIISLDTAALDVTARMQRAPRPWLTTVFGADEVLWKAASPSEYMDESDPPLLIVCSANRAWPCPTAEGFAEGRANIDVLPVGLDHRPVNAHLGSEGAYTDAVDDWLAGVDVR